MEGTQQACERCHKLYVMGPEYRFNCFQCEEIMHLEEECNQLLKEKDRAIWGTVADGNQDARNTLVLLTTERDEAIRLLKAWLNGSLSVLPTREFLKRLDGGGGAS